MLSEENVLRKNCKYEDQFQWRSSAQKTSKSLPNQNDHPPYEDLQIRSEAVTTMPKIIRYDPTVELNRTHKTVTAEAVIVSDACILHTSR